MMRKIKTTFYHLNIRFKIWLCMITIVLTLSIFIGGISGWYFTKLFLENSYENAQNSMLITEQYFLKAYTELLENIVVFAADEEFQKIILDSAAHGSANYSTNSYQLQSALGSFTTRNALVDSVIITGADDELFVLYTNVFRETDSVNYLVQNLKRIKGITWFPLTYSPFKKNEAVIPVVVPFTLLEPANYLAISDTPSETIASIILLLDKQKLETYFTQTTSIYTDSILYLTDQKGICLNLEPSDSFYETAMSVKLINAVKSTGTDTDLTLVLENDEYLVYRKQLSYSDLHLVSIVYKDSLMERMQNIRQFIIIIIVIGLGITTYLSFALSNFITRPLSGLMKVIAEIKENHYDTPYKTKYNDEIGQLNQSINVMYDTIQKQIEQIKIDERAKFSSEIQLLAEQINPHFLYNTLECINLEILNVHTDIAASMVESLGAFLRIGLNYGREEITIGKEIEHVNAYVNIMNHRFNQPIQVTIDVPQPLMVYSILKTILQPLAENSIKHGFEKSKFQGIILIPSIDIQIFTEDNLLTIVFSDNGCGIDIEKAENSLRHSDKEGHVGLHNVYQRLRVFYDSAEIRFESIPYYKNSVILVIPYMGISEEETII